MNCPYCLSTAVTQIGSRCDCGRCHRRWSAEPAEEDEADTPGDQPPPSPDPQPKRKR